MSSQSRTLKNSTNLTGTKVWEKTMLSCSSEEIDIIESSIIENEKNFQFQHKKICFTRSKAHILLKNNAHTKGDNDLHNSKVNSSSLR